MLIICYIKTINIPSSVLLLSFFCFFNTFNLIELSMDFSPHKIQRITKWIQSEVDYNFLNPAYTIAFNYDQVLLEHNNKELKQVCLYCLLVPKYQLYLKCWHFTCLQCLREYRRHRFMFEKILPCPICKQSCHFNEIYTYQVENNTRPNSISMRMFQRVKFICTYPGCGESYPWKQIHHHKMFECPYRSILCPAQGCELINNVETVIIHLNNCYVHLLYCAICKSLYNVSVLTHDCNIIKSNCTMFSVFKYYHNISPPNHSHKDVFIRTNSYIKLLKIERKSTMICSWA